MDQKAQKMNKFVPMFSAVITKTTESNFVSFGVFSYAFAMLIASGEVEVLVFFTSM